MVLLSEGDKPSKKPLSYRPLYILDTAGKFIERIIHGRIEEIAEKNLSRKRYGFRKGWGGGYRKLSSVGTGRKKSFQLGMLKEVLTAMKVPGYLRKIACYFTTRVESKYDTENGSREYRLSGWSHKALYWDY